MGYVTRSKKLKLSRLMSYSSNGLDSLTNEAFRLTDVSESRNQGYPQVGYKQKIKDLKSATTPLDGYRSKIKGLQKGKFIVDVQFLVSGNLWVPRRQVSVGFPGQTQTISEFGTQYPDYAAADAGASKKFYKKVKALDQSFDGMVWLGELRESIRMFKNPLKALRRSAGDDYLNACRRLKRRDPQSWTKGLAGAYLEWFYGWRPVLSDIESAFETFEALTKPKVEAHLVHAPYRIEPAPSVSYTSSAVDNGYFHHWYKVEEATQTKVLYKGLYAREVMRQGQPWSYGDIAGQLGLTMSNFVPTAWELLPWSFLIDYFTNIGDMLECTYTSLQNVRWINRTRRHWRRKLITCGLNQDTTKAWVNGVAWRRYVSSSCLSQAISSSQRVSFYRDDKYPEVPPLQFELPGSPQKWIAMAALFSEAADIYPQKTRNPFAYQRRRR